MFHREIEVADFVIVRSTLAHAILAWNCALHEIYRVIFIAHIEGTEELFKDVIGYERIRQKAQNILKNN